MASAGVPLEERRTACMTPVRRATPRPPASCWSVESVAERAEIAADLGEDEAALDSGKQ